MKEPSHIAYRRGRVVISGTMIRQNPEQLLPIFARLVPIAIEHDKFNDRYTYLCVSPDFKLWNPVEAVNPPEYNIEIKTENDAVVKVTFI